MTRCGTASWLVETALGGGRRRCRVPEVQWLGSLLVFIVVLAVMKYFFGWPISIGGSLVLSLILTGVFSLFNRR
jgi:hypothetical protein